MELRGIYDAASFRNAAALVSLSRSLTPRLSHSDERTTWVAAQPTPWYLAGT